MTHVTCRLTAKNRDQLRNPTLGNRVWATFTFYTNTVGVGAQGCEQLAQSRYAAALRSTGVRTRDLLIASPMPLRHYRVLYTSN